MIYDRVRELAKKKGITIQKMEQDLSLPVRNTCKWNDSLPRIDTLKRVADYFDVTVDYFLK